MREAHDKEADGVDSDAVDSDAAAVIQFSRLIRARRADSLRDYERSRQALAKCGYEVRPLEPVAAG